MAPLLAKLKAEETSKKSLVGELDLLTVLLTVSVDVVSFDEPQTRDPGAYGRLKGTSTGQRSEARQILRKFEAYEDEMGRKGYRVSGQGSYLSLMPSPLVSPCLVSPMGIDGLWKGFNGSCGIPFKGFVSAA